MPSAADLTPQEIAAVLAARRRHEPVEDELPPSLTARLDREVAARVDAELAARTGLGMAGQPATIQVVQKKERNSGAVVGVASLVLSIPLISVVEGITHGNIFGAAIVMAGVVAVNWAHAFGRRHH